MGLVSFIILWAHTPISVDRHLEHINGMGDGLRLIRMHVYEHQIEHFDRKTFTFRQVSNYFMKSEELLKIVF